MSITPDRDVCVCFHVSLRKLYHYARRERPRVGSQLTECLGAGTGCQSCVPLLDVIAERAADVEIEGLADELNAFLEERDQRRREKLGREH